VRRPFPDWVDYRPNQIWMYDTTRFTRAGVAVTVVEDLVSRKWIGDIVSAEETSTQVEIVLTHASAVEGLLARVEARADGLVDRRIDDPARPILLAVTDNGPQMTYGSTREFMAMFAIAQPFGRPGTPTDQAWIESFFGHIKNEFPHLCATPPCSEPSSSSCARTTTPSACAPGSLRHPARRARRARSRHPQSPRGPARNRRPPTPRLPSNSAQQHPEETRRCWLFETGSLSRSRKQVRRRASL
jgi:transposase InsO family protein